MGIGAAIRNHNLVYLKINIDDKNTGLLWVKLSPKVFRTTRNFYFLCTGQKGLTLCDTKLHYIKPGEICAGGTGVGGRPQGRSIYGAMFVDESFHAKHNKRGTIAMHTSIPDSNTSLFHITFNAMPALDLVNVVFGDIIEGFDVLDAIEAAGSETGKPTKDVRIVECGKYNELKHAALLSSASKLAHNTS